MALAALATGLCGCPNPNSYGTPRTVAPGELSHSVAVEGFGYTNEGDGGFLPTLPSYQLRIGATDFMDVGVQVRNLTSLGVDVKLNPVRGVFDLAVDPGAQYFFVTSGDATVHVAYLHAPLMLGLNPSDWFSVVLTPGFTYGIIGGSFDNGSESASQTVDGAILRGGLGLNFRISDGFAIHPEGTVMKMLEGDGLVYNVGIGFNFGALPSFADLAD
ncbi:MAG TPA: hypothetical protein VLS89_06290 [Candidatus Nanopelagicales bacterium]|nr:hypothetical protein [Candidatus Nanopelagicales bacterium]